MAHAFPGHWNILIPFFSEDRFGTSSSKQCGPSGQKKNGLVRVTAEKTLGRVGRYFFFFCNGSHAG